MSAANLQMAPSVRTILLCFIVAILEGFDLQSVGVAAPAMAATFKLDSAALGWVFSAGLIGLLPGAVCGGWLADRFGRKQVLIGAVILFGLFSLLTAHSATYQQLLVARLITGLGMGAALFLEHRPDWGMLFHYYPGALGVSLFIAWLLERQERISAQAILLDRLGGK